MKALRRRENRLSSYQGVGAVPFYFRKSVNAGPFRFNFSKGGVGVSVGVKGLRVGTGPRGHYVHAGRGGFYYRATIGRAGEKRAADSPPPFVDRHQLIFDNAGVEMVEIESGDVGAMRDEAFGDILDEINAKQRQISMASLLGWGLGIFGVFVGFATAGVGIGLALLAIPGWAVGRWVDSYRRTTVLFYEFEPELERAYQTMVGAFDSLCGCAAKWHVEAGGAVRDLTTWKRNAGATHIVRKKPTLLAYRLPRVIKSNVTPPALQVGKQTVYFLPDVALIEDGKSIGAVSYAQFSIDWQDSNFIEDGSVPRDAQVIGQTWKHPNKSGGPDRRFRENYQIPICRYEVMHLTSSTGVNELVEFSKTGVVSPFATAIRALSQSRGSGSPQTARLP